MAASAIMPSRTATPSRSMTSGHQIRDHVFANPPHAAEDTGEVFDFVIVGGGLSGLGTAPILQAACAAREVPRARKPSHLRRRGKTERVHRRRPPADQRRKAPTTLQRRVQARPTADLYASIGVDATKFEYQAWQGSFAGDSRGQQLRAHSVPFRHLLWRQLRPAARMWIVDPWTKKLEGAPHAGGDAGRNPEIPGAGRQPSRVSQKSHELDAITMEQYMMQKFGISQETIRKFLMPGPGDGFGIGPDVLSAYAFGFGGDP